MQNPRPVRRHSPPVVSNGRDPRTLEPRALEKIGDIERKAPAGMGSIQFLHNCSKLVSIERSCFLMAITPRAALLVHASSSNRRKRGSKSLVYRDFP